MKSSLLICFFFFLSFTGKCDTIDYWNIYLNNEKLADFNEAVPNRTITLKKKDLKPTDVLTIRYGSDHPCGNCETTVSVFAEVKRKLPEVTSNNSFGPFELSIGEILEIMDAEKIDHVGINYSEKYEHNGIRMAGGNLLFTLRIE